MSFTVPSGIWWSRKTLITSNPEPSIRRHGRQKGSFLTAANRAPSPVWFAAISGGFFAALDVRSGARKRILHRTCGAGGEEVQVGTLHERPVLNSERCEEPVRF